MALIQTKRRIIFDAKNIGKIVECHLPHFVALPGAEIQGRRNNKCFYPLLHEGPKNMKCFASKLHCFSIVLFALFTLASFTLPVVTAQADDDTDAPAAVEEAETDEEASEDSDDAKKSE